MSRNLFRNGFLHFCGVGFELRLQRGYFDFDCVETEPERAFENFFEQGAQIGFGLEHVAVYDADGNFEFDAVFVDDESDSAGFDSVDAVERFFYESADYAESGFAVAALFAAESDFSDGFTAYEKHGEHSAREQQVKHGESDEQTFDEVVVELFLFDAAECRHEENDDENHSDDDARGCENLLDVFLHIVHRAS